MSRVVCWFSAGAASAVAAKLTLSAMPDAVLAYCDTGAEHPDNERFMADCAAWFGKRVQTVSGDNMATGQALYAAGDQETRDWFHKQWRIWPKRADARLTTNISLHCGGVVAYRIENDGRDPPMSDQFRECVAVLIPTPTKGPTA